MNTTIVTIVGTLVMLDYCSTSKKDEDGDYNFNEFYYQTAGFLDFEGGGLFVNDGIPVLDNNDSSCVYGYITNNFFYAQGSNAGTVTYG